MRKIMNRSLCLLLSATLLTLSPFFVYASSESTPATTPAATPTATPTAVPTTSSAELIKLKKNTTLRYNVTGNKTKEKIKYTVSDKALTITMNNKKIFTTSDADKYTVKLCVLENGKIFFNIAREWSEGNWQKNNRLYRLKGNKLVAAKTLLANSNKRYQINRSDVVSVKGNELVVRYTGTTNITGIFMWKGVYKYTKGYNMKRLSNSMDAYYKKTGHKNSWRVNKAFWTYTKPLSKVKAFKTKANEVVTIDCVFSDSKSLSMKITRQDGTSAWLQSPKTVKRINRYFKNVQLTL